MEHGHFEQPVDLTYNFDPGHRKHKLKNVSSKPCPSTHDPQIHTLQKVRPPPHVLGENGEKDEEDDDKTEILRYSSPLRRCHRNANVRLKPRMGNPDVMTSNNDEEPSIERRDVSTSTEENEESEETPEFLGYFHKHRPTVQSICPESMTPHNENTQPSLFRLALAKERRKRIGQDCAEVSGVLIFKKYWSFNHSIYFSDVRIKNTSTGWIAYKVTPSNCVKLCIGGCEFQGVIGPHQNRLITVVTNSMIPYKYVDIMDENVEVVVVPVELQGVDYTPAPLLGFSSSCRWKDVTHGDLDDFWSFHSPDQSHTHSMSLYRIEKLRPYDLMYLTEESVMMTWDSWMWNCITRLYKLKPWEGLSHLLLTQFGERRHKVQNVPLTLLYSDVSMQKMTTDSHLINQENGWSETGLGKYLLGLYKLKPWKKLSQSIITQFDTNRHIVRSIVAVMVPPHTIDLDTTQNIATGNHEFSRLRKKQKIIKFIICGSYFYFLLFIVSWISNLWEGLMGE